MIVVSDVECPILIGTPDVAVPIVIPLDVLELSIFNEVVASSEIVVPSTANVPSMSVLSRLEVPSTARSSAIVTLPSATLRDVAPLVPVIIRTSSEASHVRLSPAVPEYRTTSTPEPSVPPVIVPVNVPVVPLIGLPLSCTVPDRLGNVIVLSAVGSVMANVVSYPSEVPPSKVRGLAPCNVAPTVKVSAAASPRTKLPFSVVVPVTVNALPTVRFPLTATVPSVTVALGVTVTWSTNVPCEAISLPIPRTPSIPASISHWSLASSPSSAYR